MTHSHMDSSIYILASLALDLADRHWRPGEMPREIWQPMHDLIGADASLGEHVAYLELRDLLSALRA